MLTCLRVCVWWSQTNLDTPRSLEPVRRHLVQASNVLVTINSAVNFIVYCMISRKFRQVLVRHCCCCTSPSPPLLQGVTQRHAEHTPCCWRVRHWCRQMTRLDSWRHSDGDDSKRSTTATNHYEPRSNVTPVQLTTPAKPLGLLLAPQHLHDQQQQHQQLVEMRPLTISTMP